MLAYVFWHGARPSVAVNSYEENLIKFHKELQVVKSPGFLFSTVFKTSRVPWLNLEADYYSDWYIIKNSAALDLLNENAVGKKLLEIHNNVARQTASGIAGLYHDKRGIPNFSNVKTLYWFNKPDEMQFIELENLLKPAINSQETNLWQRHMTLGPSPEFGLFSTDTIIFPENIKELSIDLTCLWNGTEQLI